MTVYAAMVEHVLAKGGADVCLVGNPECKVERISLYGRGDKEAGTLYVADAEAAVAPVLKPKKKGKGKGKAKKAGKASGGAVSSDADYAVIQWASARESVELIEAAYQAMRSIDEWEASLKDALLADATIGEFIALGRPIVSYPYAYLNNDCVVLAASDDYTNETGFADGGIAGDASEGCIVIDAAAGMTEGIDCPNAANIQGGFYCKDASNRMFYGLNTFDGETCRARLVLALPDGVQLLNRGEEQLVELYHTYLGNLHARLAGRASAGSSQNDSLHALVRKSMLGVQPPADEASSVLASHGWAADDDFQVTKIVFFEGVHWDTASFRLCAQLEAMMPESCAFSEDRSIMWLVDLTRSTRSGESLGETGRRFVDSLVQALSSYACKAGVSNVFARFEGVREFYFQAEYALALGQAHDPQHRYYRFSDYAYEYLLACCASEMPPDQVCHPALAKLLVYDGVNGTEYARTLVCFLRHSQNTTHAATELFIHRTSFMRRMAQIARIVEFDFNDHDQVLHLLLSAKLLGL